MRVEDKQDGRKDESAACPDQRSESTYPETQQNE